MLMGRLMVVIAHLAAFDVNLAGVLESLTNTLVR